jgi:hypothetical protein
MNTFNDLPSPFESAEDRGGMITFRLAESREVVPGEHSEMWFRRNKEEKIRPEEGFYRAISFLTPEDVMRMGGYPTEAIIGLFEDQPGTDLINDIISVENFRPNPAFINFMHQVIGKYGPEDSGLREAARRQREGWIYIIDLRTPDGPQGKVPPEDIVGAFEVKDGQLIKESYWANERHLAFSTNGLVQLPGSLHELLMQELRNLKFQPDRA